VKIRLYRQFIPETGITLRYSGYDPSSAEVYDTRGVPIIQQTYVERISGALARNLNPLSSIFASCSINSNVSEKQAPKV
jgi:hypothetical protein